jgi:signal transduction histidine kinase
VTERRRREQEVAVLNRVLRHDLRNDVAVIENYATLLERDPGNEGSVARIADRAGEMRELVETVRQVERHLDANEPTLSAVDIARVVDERTTALARAHPEATVETDVPSGTWVRATELIGSAVDNLVENAVEHNDADTPRVSVSVERVTVDGDRYVDVTVADNGPPLADADRAVLVGEEPTLEGASGLGLWLVNWIVAESGGTVRHELADPRGNVVTLRLRAPAGEQYHEQGREADRPAVAYRHEEMGDMTGPGNGSPAG